MRVEICGHKLLPDQPRNLILKCVTSSAVTFSWIPPILDKWEKPISYFFIKIQEKISGSVVRYINDTAKTNQKEVEDLSPYTVYELSIAAGNLYGFGEEITINFTTRNFTTAEAAPKSSLEISKTALYIIIAVLVFIIAVLVIVVVRLQRSRTPTTEERVVDNTTFLGDTQECVQFPPPSAYEDVEMINKSSGHYDQLQRTWIDEDEHTYQSLQKKT